MFFAEANLRIFCYNPNGYAAGLVHIEVSIRRGLPAIDIVGLAGGAVREARERVRAAFASTGREFPFGHIVISLSPADMPKAGAAFDLAIALALAEAAEYGGGEKGPSILVMGELGLGGSVKPVEALIPALLEARQAGIRACIVPSGNETEVAVVPFDSVHCVETLSEAVAVMNSMREAAEHVAGSPATRTLRPSEYHTGRANAPADDFDLSALQSHPLLALGMLAAAAGRHHILLYGPPGVGKTMALRFLGRILPGLNEQQSMEVNRLHSLAGRIDSHSGLVSGPPVRMPHHSSSPESLLGGGKKGKPGEISLSHCGLLILDEVAEFRKHVLQALREPMEEGIIRLGRVNGMISFPANFVLAMSLNPCPCGRFGSQRGSCSCSAQDIQHYWGRIGAPIIDRTDIRVAIGMDHNPEARNLWEQSGLCAHIESVAAIQNIVGQVFRLRGKPNGSLRGREVDDICMLDPHARALMEKADQNEEMFARSRHAVLRLSRTLADLAGKERIDSDALRAAMALRSSVSPVEGIPLYR